MDGANADSDHSMTWEDFFGSTTDLTPTLIGIFDSFLEPPKKPDISRFNLTAKDARNEPPLNETNEPNKEPKADTMKGNTEPSRVDGCAPTVNVIKSTLYTIRTKVESDSVSEVKKTETNAFNNLSPNVKRMISSATDTTALKFQKKSVTGARASMRGHRSNIPLIGATSKISQSGVEILPTVEIYDQPSVIKNASKESPSKIQKLKPNFKLDTQETYDVPTNNKPAYVASNTAFESLSLPYIDQSIELSITADREFDPKIAPKDKSPQKDETSSPPSKIPKTGTNSLHRKEFGSRNTSPAKQLAKTELYPEAVSSTGNLGKEVPRLNPPTVEVSRPLSMSSIASSSSTSSSGVQNKGGVNSAYLASIESLDDHSDADMVSAGSNNFVNDAGMNKSVSEERRSEILPRQQYEAMSGLSQLERVCAEIVHTEHTYVLDLGQVVEGYLHVWRREATFSQDELSELFNNIEDIYNFNKSLCAELNACRLDETCIARCFVNNTSGFSVYTSYCTGYPRTMERLAALAGSEGSARQFRERQVALGHPLPLASYLLKPVQRILKYHLLLQNVVKQCASRETEYALLKMTGIAQHIDDMKRRHEHAVRVQEIQSLLYGWNGPDLTTYGELCAEGTFRVFGAKAMRHAFLFDKMLLITKNREDGILAYKSHIMCNNMMLVEAIAGAPLSFHVIPWDAPRSQLTLQASSPRHKREWTLLLKRVILENYNAVIPSHARQLVMELGQNRTDDDMLAEKSHNLITQASMRKQLSAPEYLEKRKLDRERRKSFENNPRGRPKKINRKHTAPVSFEVRECDCTQVSIKKGIDYTCEVCYVDLCSDCDGGTKKKEPCNCTEEGNRCPECDRSLHYIDAGSAEHLERKLSTCKCSDFKSSQESFNKDFISPLNKTRGYHSSDNIVGYDSKSKEDLTEINNSMTSVRNMPKTCLKCVKIKENIVVSESTDTLHPRKSRFQESDKHSIRSKSKDDPHRVKLSKIGTWRRKSEPGLQQGNVVIPKRTDSDSERNDKGNEKIEFECRNCGSNKIHKKGNNNALIISDPELDSKSGIKSNVQIKMYNTKNVPKKISKLKKCRAKGMRLGSDTTAKFYADLSTDVSTENILHITESTDSLNVDKVDAPSTLPEMISKDESIDEETYKKLIEKTDSFKKNELEKVQYLNKQKVINEGSEDETQDVEIRTGEVMESCEETEQPLEQIISQLLLQNREFQKLLKKQQLRNTAHRRHQRLLKSHSNPEQPNPPKTADTLKLKPKYGRQTSECVNTNEELNLKAPTPPNEEDIDEDHIYETLRVENRVDESLHSLSSKSKSIQHNTRITRPKRLPSPPDPNKNMAKMMNPDSDYVYLSFDKLDNIQDTEGIYEVPVKSPERVPEKSKAVQDYYVTIESKGPIVKLEEDLYDNIIEVCQRKKELPSSAPGEYLPMSPEHSPNTPEIWLSRQKEHFNVSRDRKSGSLPRSFQVVSTAQEEPNMTTFKTKTSNSKTYLNRDGKVMSIERPFTIASDQSEISYDDVETYMNEGDIPKFNKTNYKPEMEQPQNLSQSTLELEEEIDRCYKKNFESIKLDASKNDNLNTSIPNLNTSTTSSCEVLLADKKDIDIVHPEHKIYKPTSNLLSLKGVLSRFKSRKSNDDAETNSEQSPEGKSDLKSPTSEKRSALNPRSYSKNLLQRFRSIIGDEQPDDHQHKAEKGKKGDEALMRSDIKVVITSTNVSPTTSTIVYSSDALSKSVYDQTTLTESQNEKNNLDVLSHSCDNITKPESNKPNYEKSVSMITSVSSSVSSVKSPIKSNSNSFQNLNKLPIYMQGSKSLGARIAQSDYVDPSTLMPVKANVKNVNVLINKNAVRPDSLFSNSSFVTSSSEGTFKEMQRENTTEAMATVVEAKSLESGTTASDDSFYEKSFEKIEQVTDDDVFRDSAVYSDQEDTEDSKTESSGRGKTVTKSYKAVDSVKRDSSFKTEKVTVSENVTELKTVMHTKVTVVSKAHVLSKTVQKPQINKPKPKLAPPVPVKPKITNIPTTNMFQHRNVTKTTSLTTKTEECTDSENTKTIKRNTNLKQSFIRSESTPQERDNEGQRTVTKDVANNKSDSTDGKTKEDEKLKPTNIQIKRLSFERASLDSATRKLKNNSLENKRSSIESPKSTTNSVMERRMAIESLTKTQTKLNQSRKPSQLVKPKTFTQKSEDNSKNKVTIESSKPKPSIPVQDNVEENLEEVEAKGSWVKTVVNKFQ